MNGHSETGTIFFLLVVVTTLLLWLLRAAVKHWRRQLRFRAITMSNIDFMPGIEFERYVGQLLATRGFNVTMTSASGDLGVDLVASKRRQRIAVQVKRQEKRVSRRAVSDAVAGMQHYQCSKAMVISNNYFSRGAQTLAESTKCALIDRDALAQWIVEMQKRKIRPVLRNSESSIQHDASLKP